jgi:hypothetical protein
MITARIDQVGSVFGDTQDEKLPNREHNHPLFIKEPMGLGSYEPEQSICDRLMTNYREKFVKKGVVKMTLEESDAMNETRGARGKLNR